MNNFFQNQIELIYFVYPTCDGKCKHCWSSNKIFGSVVPKSIHEKIINDIKTLDIGTLKISGGEPFLNKDIGSIVNAFKQIGVKKINIFTSGRPFLTPFQKDKDSIKNFLINQFKDLNNITIELSADENHIDSVYKKFYNMSSLTKEEMMKNYVKNFLNVCCELKKIYTDFDYKLKIHCDIDRGDYHANELYDFIDETIWNNNVICTEGLVKSGRNSNNEKAFIIEENKNLSYFLLPGCKIEKKKDIMIMELKNNHFVNKNKNSYVIFKGWWNLIDNNPIFINKEVK